MNTVMGPGQFVEQATLPRMDAWSAFQAGMQILQRYAGRWPSDPVSIAKSNLRLLHRSLLKDHDYRQLLRNAQAETASDGLTTVRVILANQDIRADLISVQKGCTIRLEACEHCLTMYMVISGKATLDEETTASTVKSVWWQRHIGVKKTGSQKSGVMREEDVHLQTRAGGDVPLLSAGGKNCILLRVSLPLHG